MRPWKKQRANNSFLHGFSLVQLAKNSGSAIGSDVYDLKRLALRPRGGSFVILIEFWRIDTGKSLDG